MAAVQDSGTKDHGAKQTAGGGEPNRKRARSTGVDAGAGGGGVASGGAGVRNFKKKGSSAPAAAPASASSAHPESAAASLLDVTVEDADFLDCGVCFLPLKPPIFQCDVGHVVCSPCRDKLKATGKCHVCGVATSSYRRCHDMERLVDSIRVPCPYATHGCAVRTAYHDRESHRLACVHAPCHCPGENCKFVGSTTTLLDHFSAAHSWPCITNSNTNFFGMFTVRLHDGFNFLLADADCPTGNKKKGATASVERLLKGATASVERLLLLTVARQLHARVISVHWIHPHATAASGGPGPNSSEMQCKLSYSPYLLANSKSGGNQLINYSQTSTFRVACTDLSNGLPKPDECFQFVVPNSVIGDHDKDVIKVDVRIVK